MELKLNRDSDVPIYQQIIELVEKKMTSGEYPQAAFCHPKGN